MNKLRVATVALGVFAGLGGASHGPGEILQGNVAPADIFIEAWPSLTALNGEPAMTLIPNFAVTGVLAITLGLLVAAWAGLRVDRRLGGLLLALLSVVMLLVGGGLIPPLLGIAAGILGVVLNCKAASKGGENA